MLRHFNPGDAPFIIELVNSPGWIQNIGDINLRTEIDALNYITQGPVKSYAANSFGSYLISLKDKKTPIGMCSLIKRDWLDEPDLGYALLPGFEGSGYAFEAAQTCLHSMYKNGLANKMSAIVSPSNAPSIRLLEKLQFVFSKDILTPEKKEHLLLFNHTNNKI